MFELGFVLAAIGMLVILWMSVSAFRRSIVRCVVCGRPASVVRPGFPCTPHCARCLSDQAEVISPERLLAADGRIDRRWLGYAVGLGDRGKGLVVVLNDGGPAVAYGCECGSCGGLAWAYLRPGKCVDLAGVDVADRVLCPRCRRDADGT